MEFVGKMSRTTPLYIFVYLVEWKLGKSCGRLQQLWASLYKCLWKIKVSSKYRQAELIREITGLQSRPSLFKGANPGTSFTELLKLKKRLSIKQVCLPEKGHQLNILLHMYYLWLVSCSLLLSRKCCFRLSSSMKLGPGLSKKSATNLWCLMA